MQKIKFTPLKFVRDIDPDHVVALPFYEPTHETILIPVCETPEEYEGMRLSLYSPVGSDFLIDKGFPFICRQTGYKLDTPEFYDEEVYFDPQEAADTDRFYELVEGGFDKPCHSITSRDATYLFFTTILNDLIAENHIIGSPHKNRLFETQVRLAQEQGVKSNRYVFLQDHDEKVGTGFIDEHGVSDEYVRQAGHWYWHPENQPSRCTQILSEDLIQDLAKAVGQDPKTFVNGVLGELVPKERKSDLSSRETLDKKSVEKALEEACVGKTYGEILLPALGEYLAKFREKNLSISESYTKALTEYMKHIRKGGLVLENCYAILYEGDIIAMTSSEQVAKEIVSRRGLIEAEVMPATDALRQLTIAQPQKS